MRNLIPIPIMNTPQFLLDDAKEYVSTFDVSTSTESYMFKGLTRDELTTMVQSLEFEHQTIFYQLVLTGLQELQERLASNPSAAITLKAVHRELSKVGRLLKQLSNPLNQSSSKALVDARIPVQKPSVEEQQEIARGYIAFLGEVNLQGIQIMSKKEFANLQRYTDYLIQHNKLPGDITPINPTFIPKGYISYTYYLIHKRLYGTRPKRVSFIHFLKAVFVDFSKDPNFDTLKTKFSVMPSGYDNDMKILTGKIGKVS